jgi:hypothetical protein
VVLFALMKSKLVQAVEKLHAADRLMRDAIKLLPKNRRFVQQVVDIQLQLDDAITLADPKQTMLK